MIKKRIYLIAAIALAFVLLTVAYFVVIAPMLEETNEDEKIELLEGEVLGQASSILMFDQVERANIKSIEVHNEHGGYTFYYDEEKEDFFFENYLDAPYNKEMISSLVTSTGYPATMKRVTEKAEDLSIYGLDESKTTLPVLTSISNSYIV